MAKKKIRMQHPDGEREWIAETEAEAHELMARGYRRLDGEEETTPPAAGARDAAAKDAPKAGGKATPTSTS